MAGSEGQPGGLIPKLLGQGPKGLMAPRIPSSRKTLALKARTCPALPLYREENLPAGDARTNSATAQTLFDVPPIPSNASAEEQAQRMTEGNPFRLVQHQLPVSDVSSSDRRNATPPAANPQIVPRNSPGPSQLDRLKIALSQDAKNSIPVRSQAEASEVSRQRVEAMMKTARRQIQQGEYASALKWATAAEDLARRAELFFGPEEDPPADLVRVLQDRLKVPPTGIEYPMPIVEPLVVQAHPVQPPAPPTLSIEFPESDLSDTKAPWETLPPEEAQVLSSLPHSTHAMQQAVIAPETLSPAESPVIVPSPAQREPGELHSGLANAEPRRVGVNQGAAVSVEGPLDPPMEMPLPSVPLAPPATEIPPLPPFEVAMSEPAISAPIPPLPPPTASAAPVESAAPFLYSESNPPAPGTLKNVDWEEADAALPPKDANRWILPASILGGIILAGFLLLKRKRG